METREMIRYKLEEMSRQEMVEKERIQRSQAETNELFLTVPSEDAISEEHQSNLEQEDTVENRGESDSDWEDCDNVEEVTREYNTMSLKHFSMECERYDVSDRAASKLGNALLRDLGLVRRGGHSKTNLPD